MSKCNTGKNACATCVFLIAFLALSSNLWLVDIASGWIDPLLHYGAQDEAAYTRQAIHMATQGNWMTPMLLGRWVLEKPPLLMWLSAISMKLFGISSFTPRLPAVLSGALIITLCFAIARASRSSIAGIIAALLCLSNPVLFTMSRHNMTDILLTAAAVTVLAVLAFDPTLSRPASRSTFTLAIAAGILTKSIAGLLPAAAALLFACWTANRPVRVLRLSAIAVLLGSAWFLYHLITHRQWFLADQQFQILSIGLQPHQNLRDTKVGFYLLRFLYAAPVTLALSFTGVPALLAAVRRREAVPVLLSCFLIVFAGALFAFRFRSETYLTPLFPVVILIAAITSPLLRKWFAVSALAALFVLKAANPGQAWGISYRPGSTVPAAGTLSSYCEEHRGNDLYILGVDDQLYALALPLARLHYGWIDPDGEIKSTRPHLVYLGIMQAANEHADNTLYASRLRAWGMNSTEALGTGISAPTTDDLAAVVLAHPESDFLVSPQIARLLAGRQPQTMLVNNPNFVLLQSKMAQARVSPSWTCNL
ncbi:MAG: ArnT family glycosyltransferase [Bryobacteraceae bacterium]